MLVDEQIEGIDAPFVAADNRQGARSLAEYVLGCWNTGRSSLRGEVAARGVA